jgi:hypothetical protein
MIRQKESEKNEAWHREMHDYFLAQGNLVDQNTKVIDEAYAYYHGQNNQQKHNFLTITSNGTQWPIEFTAFNRIRPIIEEMVGRYSARAKDIGIYATSPKAVARRSEAMAKLDADWQLLPLLAEDQEVLGMPTIPSGTPLTEKEYQHKRDTYKEQGEIIYHQVIKRLMATYKIKDIEERILRDILITSMGFCSVYMDENGVLKVKWEDPRTIITDSSSDCPWYSDARFFARCQYLPLSRVKSEYGLTDEQLDKVVANTKSQKPPHIGIGSIAAAAIGATGSFPVAKGKGEDPYVLVTYVEFKDYKEKVLLEFRDRRGNNHYRILDQELNKNTDPKIDSKKVRNKAESIYDASWETTRKVLVVGGVTVSYGECENIPRRTYDDWWKSAFSIIGHRSGYAGGASASVLMLISSLQDLINESMYMVKKKFLQDRGNATIVDMSQNPEGYSLQDISSYGETLGLIPVNSRAFGSKSGYNQFTTARMGIDQGAMFYINVASFCINQIYQITGLDPMSSKERVAEAPAETTRLRTQGSLVRTESIYRAFERMTEEVYQRLIGIAKINIAHNLQKYEAILDQASLDFIKQDKDFDLDDYGLQVKSRGLNRDMSVVHEATSNAMMNGQVPYLDGVKMLLEDDPKQALVMLEKAFAERDTEQSQAMEQQAMEEQAAREQAMQANAYKATAPVEVAQINADAKIATKQMDIQQRASMTPNIAGNFRGKT